MRAGTHIVAGVAVGYVIGVAAAWTPLSIAALGALGGLCAMVPDIDHPQSAIRRKTGALGTAAAFWMNHRGITHTLLAAAVFALVCALIARPEVAAAMAGGYLSHLILDACTPSGVPFLGPLSWRRFHLLPGGMRVRTGSFAEKGVLLTFVVVLFWSSWNGYGAQPIQDRLEPSVIIESAIESAISHK
jgi:inner membrane protein